MIANKRVTTKAIALMSGGLDSNLAVRMIHDMGIEIIGVHFTGPFCLCNRGSGGCIQYARKIADELGIRFSTIGLGSDYLDIVVHPRHGRGSGMNPCLDCRILMLRRARQMMHDEGASFIFTGEVLGQRPMSQLRKKLSLIEREADLEGLILRPLSARHFDPTVPEQKGWVDRGALLDIQGRSRKPQIALAEKMQIGDYPCPAGGCLLTDRHFAARLREHMEHAGALVMADIPLLKLGRHFRLTSGGKLVVARDEDECSQLETLARDGDVLILPSGVSGPSGLLRDAAGDADAYLAAQVLAAYCGRGESVDLELRRDGEARFLTVTRSTREEFADLAV